MVFSGPRKREESHLGLCPARLDLSLWPDPAAFLQETENLKMQTDPNSLALTAFGALLAPPSSPPSSKNDAWKLVIMEVQSPKMT